MNKQQVINQLNEKYNQQIWSVSNWNDTTEEQIKIYIKEQNYNVKAWVVGKLLCDLTTYSEKLDDKWYKLLVLFMRRVNNKNFEVDITDEEFVLCFNLLRGSGWRFNWGINIYSCWIDWERNSEDLCLDWLNEIRITKEILDWCLEWVES